MSQNYAPLWNTILTSSIWSETKETRLLFVTMIAAKDAEGIVRAALPGLARMANLTLEETMESIAVLESPDPHSSSAEHGGRRVLKVEGGWQVINHQKYRDKITELKAYNARKQAEYRKRRAQALAAQYKPKMVKTPQEVDFEKGFEGNP